MLRRHVNSVRGSAVTPLFGAVNEATKKGSERGLPCSISPRMPPRGEPKGQVDPAVGHALLPDVDYI